MYNDTSAFPRDTKIDTKQDADGGDSVSSIGRVLGMRDTLKRDREVADTLAPEALSPPKLTPAPNPNPQTDPVNAFGQPAMWLAIFGSLLTRQHLTAAVTSAAGVMAATQRLDAEAAKSNYEQWKVNSKNAIDTAKYVQNAYKAAISKIGADARGASAEVGVLAKAFKDDAMLHVYQKEGMDGVVRFIKGRGKQLDEAESGSETFGAHAGGVIDQQRKIVDGLSSGDPNKAADSLDLYADSLMSAQKGKGSSASSRMQVTSVTVRLRGIAQKLRSGDPAQVAEALKEAESMPDIGPGVLKPPKAAPTAGSIIANREAIARQVEEDPAWADRSPGDKAVETERRFKEAQQQPIGDDTADWIAREVWSGNPNAAVGMARSVANMTKVANAIARYAKANNLDPGDLNAKIAQFQSQMTEARTIGGRVGAIEVSGQEAKRISRLVDAAYSKLSREDFRPYNQLKAMVERGTNSPEQGAALLADFSLATAYARALNPQGVPRESDIAKAEQMLNNTDTYERHMAVVNQMMLELEQVEGATGDARANMIQRIRSTRGLGGLPALAAAPPAHADGDVSTSKSGRPIIFRNGNWEYQ